MGGGGKCGEKKRVKLYCHCERLQGAKQSNGQLFELIVREIAKPVPSESEGSVFAGAPRNDKFFLIFKLKH